MSSLALNEICWLDGSVALVVRGVVDDDTVEQFEQTLAAAIRTRSSELVIDLTGCQLAAAGFEALIRLQKRARSRPAATPLVATDVDMLRLMQIVGLASRFRIYATLDAALRASRAALPAAGEDQLDAGRLSSERARQ